MTDHAVPEHPMAAARESTAVFRTGTWRFERPVLVERAAPCSEACPLGQDIPGVMALHERGLHREALRVILEENPFPGLCGRICFHPCERVCNRARFDQAVSIRDLERFAEEQAPDEGFMEPPRADRPSRVAVLGGGPAGLSCARFLAGLGHGVTIYEPGDRLAIYGETAGLVPETLLEREPGRLSASGPVEIVTGVSTGPEALRSLSRSHDAVYIAGTGPGMPGPIELPPARVFTLRDLRRARESGAEDRLSGSVVVAGGGPAALEAARLILELGGRPKILCASSRERFGAGPGGLEAAEAEGIEVRFESGIRALSQENDRLRILPGGPAARPAFRVETEADALVMALELKGARPEWIPRILPPGLVALQDPSSTLAPDAPAAERSRGIIRALGAGKRAALILDLCLRGRALDVLAGASLGRLGALSARAYEALPAGGIERRLTDVVRYDDLNTACFRSVPRSKPRRGGSLTPGQAVSSARRCFQCGRCTFCGACDDYCPDVSIRSDRAERLRAVDYEHCKGCGICARECPRGAIVMANGVGS